MNLKVWIRTRPTYLDNIQNLTMLKNLEIQLNQIKSLHPHFQGEKIEENPKSAKNRIDPEREKAREREREQERGEVIQKEGVKWEREKDPRKGVH